MIEPLLNMSIPDSFYGPMRGLGRWSEIPYEGGVAGLLWTNTAQALMVLRTDYREEAVAALDELEDKRRKGMADQKQPDDVFDELQEGKIFTGLLEKDLLEQARTLMVYDTNNTRYYRIKKTNTFIKVTDNQSFIRQKKMWVPVEDYNTIMNKDLITVDFSTILSYE